MAFKKYDSYKIGDKVITTKIIGSCAGEFEIGSIVEIIGINPRGYDVADNEGNKVLEVSSQSFMHYYETPLIIDKIEQAKCLISEYINTKYFQESSNNNIDTEVKQHLQQAYENLNLAIIKLNS